LLPEFGSGSQAVGSASLAVDVHAQDLAVAGDAEVEGAVISNTSKWQSFSPTLLDGGAGAKNHADQSFTFSSSTHNYLPFTLSPGTVIDRFYARFNLTNFSTGYIRMRIFSTSRTGTSASETSEYDSGDITYGSTGWKFEDLNINVTIDEDKMYFMRISGDDITLYGLYLKTGPIHL
jgi:hypothetical protein